MRFHNILIWSFLFSLFFVNVNNGYKTVLNLTKTNEEILIKKDSTVFITETFRKACNNDSYTFVDWQTQCKTMWNLDYIGWSKIDNFMDPSEKNKSSVYCGIWRGNYGNGEVYCRSNN